MKLGDFLNKKLGEMSPDERRAALDAVQDIIDSRRKRGGGGGGMPPIGPDGGPIEIGIDPDLNRPKPKDTDNKDDDPFTDIDIDINDPENLLPEEEDENGKGKGKGKGKEGKSKENKDKEDQDGEGEGEGEDQEDGEDEKSKSGNGQGNSKQNGKEKPTDTSKNSGGSDNIEFDGDQDQQNKDQNTGADSNSKKADKDSDEKNSNGQGSGEQDSDEKNSSEDQQNGNGNGSKKDDEHGENKGDTSGNGDQKEYQGYEENENDPNFDPDDVKKQDRTDVTGKSSNRDYKKHQINRTINEIKDTIKAAEKSGKVDQNAIDQLKKDLADLEQHKDEYAKLPEDELGNIINKYIKDIDAVHPVYKTPDPEKRGARIKQIINDEKFQKDLDAEEFANIRKAALDAEEDQYMKARENEVHKYKNFDTLHDLEIDLYETIKDQVTEYEDSLDSYSRLNPRYEDEDNVIMPGELITDEQRIEKPTVQVYYDQSLSWDADDIKRGDRVVKVLDDMVTKNLLDVQIWYFSNVITTDKNDSRLHRGTWAWDEICNNIIKSAAKNVILMTDSDMDSQAASSKAVEVPGCVWIIWKNGEDSKDIARKLRGFADGAKGNRQYAFSTDEDENDDED